MTSRRTFLKGGVAAAVFAPAIASAQAAAGKVVVVGGGYAGATAARTLKTLRPATDVTLVEPNPVYTSCPFSNSVLANLREIGQQQFRYDGIKRTGVKVAETSVTAVDADAKSVTLADGSKLPYDRLVMNPGIDFIWNAIQGYDEAASQKMPHAWKAGAQTVLLRQQLQAMEDGGLVVMSVPANPYRCPPGPYERASLIAYWLKVWKPKSKLLLLDAKDAFSKQRLFQNGWAELYPGMIEWVSLSKGGKVTAVDPATLTFTTEFGSHKAAVANVIPPQRAGAIAAQAGVADRTGWCPVEPVSFESTLRPNIHVLGDAAIMGGMPKSAFAANAQAKVCAAALVELLAGRKAADPILINTCYSLLAADYGISVAGVYRPDKGQLTDVPGAGGNSPLEVVGGFRGQEALYASSWFRTITSEVFG
ncbi:MAG: cytochrome C [Reyranella sp.]|nr:MAG: cytochrome C [Reyranella sp.]